MSDVAQRYEMDEHEILAMGDACDSGWATPFGFDDGMMPVPMRAGLITRSPLAIWTPTRSFRANVTPKNGICIHHVAGVTNNLVHIFDSRNVSTQYCVGVSGSMRQYVDDSHVSFATGTRLGNENFINIELSNSAGAPGWPISELTIDRGIELIVDIALRHGIYPLIPNQNFRQHSQFVATYCAGRAGDRIAEIAARVNVLIESGGIPALPAPLPPPVPERPIVRRGSLGEYVKIVQRAVGADDDGDFGPLTEAAVREFQALFGLGVDGIVGPQTWGAITFKTEGIIELSSVPVIRRGSLGEYVKVAQRAVGADDDGDFGPLTERAVREFQARHRIPATGIVDGQTWAIILETQQNN